MITKLTKLLELRARLRPCQICGSTEHVHLQSGGAPLWEVVCLNPGCEAAAFGGSPEVACQNWNDEDWQEEQGGCPDCESLECYQDCQDFDDRDQGRFH